jgi:Polyketide cyclase / dehydrase and lipid transport
MTVDVQTEIVIARPLHVVATYAADPTHAPEWYGNIRSVEWVTEPGVRIGAKVRFSARFLGRTLEYTYEIAELEPDARLVMRTEQGPFPMETTYAWTELDDASTRMTLRNRGEPIGFSKVASKLMIPAMRRANNKDLVALERLLVSEPRA